MNEIHNLNRILTQQNSNFIPNKISASLYFYLLSRFENNKKYEELADKYLNKLVEEMDSIRSIDMQNGLVGIGCVVHYLVKEGFVSGDINHILKDIDDYLFRTLSVSEHCEPLDAIVMIQVLFYFYIRLKKIKKNSENEYLFREVCIKTINNIYSKIEKASFGNYHSTIGSRLSYNIESELPLFLYVISKISTLNIYNFRIFNILKELSPIILSTIPILHCNKLYLLWSMVAIYKQIKINGWDTHIELLKRELNLDEIVNTELKNRNIFFNDGATSIFLLTEDLKKTLDEEVIYVFQQKLLEKIEQSEVWHLLETDPKYFSVHNSLYDGFCGVSLLLMNQKK